MTFSEYQNDTPKTAVYKNNLLTQTERLSYVTLGLTGESGEIANKVKKILRDNNGIITQEFIDNIEGEIGDTLYYISQLCNELGLKLSDCARKNILKLQDRARRGVIQGNGDNR